jgi:hypothetical protein
VSFAAVVERLQTLENPYPGLRPFETTESHLFFGRDVQVAELVTRLERHRFVAVLGVSGSGKSSLVRAGLIPALERGHVAEAGGRWRMVVTRQAGTPFESLAADLERVGLEAAGLRQSSHGLIRVAGQLPPDESLLVVVDQFEELFRYKDLRPLSGPARQTQDRLAADAAEFVQLILAASRHHPPVYVVLTMRSDYLGDCAEFRDLPETLNDCQYLVPRMTRQQRKEAIERPLGRVAIAPSLVQRVLNDAGDEPDQLPVLQHALMRTWSHWRRSDPDRIRRIELGDYEAIGGFAGALNRHADELLAGVPPETAERVFKRLTARGRSSRERRDPARLAEIWAVCGAVTRERQAEVTGVVDHFRRGDATFLNPLAGAIEPDTYIDITHESLIRLWQKLRDEWLPEEQQAAKTLFDLVERAGTWKAGRGELLVGLDLASAAAWDRRRNTSVAWAQHYVDDAALRDVVEFLAASHARARRGLLQRRAAWGAGLLLVLGVLGWAVNDWAQARRAEAQKAKADAQTAVNQARAAETELVASKRPDAGVVPPPPGGGPTVPSTKPTVYIQVRSQAEAERVRQGLARVLEKAEFIVPRPEVLSTGPSANEVRFFRDSERQKAEQLVQVLAQAGVGKTRAVYVTGYEGSGRIRPQHLELWLVPDEALATLVQQLNDPSTAVRKAAGGRLAGDHRSDPVAIGLVLDTLSERNLPSLTVEGRINALHFLNGSELAVWTDEHKRLAREAVERIRRPGAGGGPEVGQQASQLLTDLEQRVGR